MNFWRTYRRAPIDILKWWQFWRLSLVRQTDHYTLNIPPFLVGNIDVGVASSFIVTEFRFNSPAPFSISGPLPIFIPNNPQFCLAVRAPQNNLNGLNVTRYKLWSGVGERLVFPNYNGELLPVNVAFEIWSLVPSVDTIILSVPYTLRLSLLATPTDISMCCFGDPTDLPDSQYCSLFATKNDTANYPIPIVFNTCLNDVAPLPPEDQGIITEDGSNKITDQNQDPLIVE